MGSSGQKIGVLSIIIIAVMIIIGNLIYYEMKIDLGKYVFIKSEVISDNANQFNLHFITKEQYDDSDFEYIGIVFPEISKEPVEWTMVKAYESDGFNGYVVTVNLEKYKLSTGETFQDAIKKREIVLTSAEIYDNNENYEKLKIGRIKFASREVGAKAPEQLKYLSKIDESINNDGSSKLNYKVNGDVLIDVVNTNQLNEVLQFGDLKINGTNIKELKLPLKVKKGDNLGFELKINKNTSFSNRTSATVDGKTKEEFFTSYLDLSFYIVEDLGKIQLSRSEYQTYIKNGRGEFFTFNHQTMKLPNDNMNIHNLMFNEMRE